MREIGEHRHRVVADCDQTEPLAVDVIEAALQLDELRFAIRSPIGRAEEDKNRALRSHQRFQRPCASGLIGQSERRNSRADLRSDRVDVLDL